MYLFIGESLGWQEIAVIGVVALIVLGPRRIPEVAKKIGKTMAEFRKITNEFKSTWENEVGFTADEKTSFRSLINDTVGFNEKNTEYKAPTQEALTAPKVKELSADEVAKLFPNNKITGNTEEQKPTPLETISEPEKEETPLSKRDWL